MMFAAWSAGLPLPISNMIAAVIYLFVNRGRSRFVAFHSLQSLLWQIPVTLVNLVAVVWLVRIIWWDQPVTGRFWGCVILAALVNIVYYRGVPDRAGAGATGPHVLYLGHWQSGLRSLLRPTGGVSGTPRGPRRTASGTLIGGACRGWRARSG